MYFVFLILLHLTPQIFCSAIVNGNLQVAAILMDKTPDPETLIFLVVEGLVGGGVSVNTLLLGLCPIN